jgi:1-acyl-sn-glycerol-3-phosphate acyltransferase
MDGASTGPGEWTGQVERTNYVYRFCRWTMRTLWRRFGRFDIRGFTNVPTQGPFMLVCNHQSDLDPALIQSIIPRPIYAVAKSGLFTVPGLGWVIRRLHSIPVRRYQVDPQSVRTALRRLRAGNGVAIYIEGERSWTGQLQDYRPGTIRMALKAGVPIIPVAISGAYQASPRWDSRIRPGLVTIQFLAPIHFARFDNRADREAAVPDAARIIMGRLGSALDAAAGNAAQIR